MPGFYRGGTDLDGRPAVGRQLELGEIVEVVPEIRLCWIVKSLFPRIFFFWEMAKNLSLY